MKFTPLQRRISEMMSRIAPVKLVVVAKTKPVAQIMEAIETGAKILGENTLQEIQKKYDLPLLHFLKNHQVELHFIGHLQKNKVSAVVKLCDAIQSVDSLPLLKKINMACERLGKKMPVFFQMNLTNEPQQHGFFPKDLPAVLNQLQLFPFIQAYGLMCFGKHHDPEQTRKVFKQCRELCDQYCLSELSMGMSDDYAIALEEGATMIRLGTALFAFPQE